MIEFSEMNGKVVPLSRLSFPEKSDRQGLKGQIRDARKVTFEDTMNEGGEKKKGSLGPQRAGRRSAALIKRRKLLGKAKPSLSFLSLSPFASTGRLMPPRRPTKKEESQS